MDTAEYLPTVAPSARSWPRWRPDAPKIHRLAGGAFWLIVVLSVAVRTYNPSALWLDEAQSVAIARLPLPQLFPALRTDGSPPLYYLLLHYWISAFGEGTFTVRFLSTVISLAALPVAYLAGRSVRDASVGRAAVVVLGVSPFAVRYATETRMYALLILLAMLEVWAMSAAARRPTVGRLSAIAVVSGLLALTHYWALFFLAAVALTVVALRRWRLLAAMAGGGLIFLPWLPGFLFQIAHTGTPWASPPSLNAIFDTGREWAGGSRPEADVFFLLALLLTAVAVAGHRIRGGLGFAWPLSRAATAVFAGTFGTLLIGVVSSEVVHAGFPVRYSAVAFAPGVVLLALGARVLPFPVRAGTLAVIAVVGLIPSVSQLSSDNRTQARETAAAISAGYQPGDLVLFCPDQLGPAISRLLPADTAEAVYPTLGPADRVDWVDYAQRNENASAAQIAQEIDERVSGAIWYVWMPGYRTYDTQCQELRSALAQLRGDPVRLQKANTHYAEPDRLLRFPQR